MDSTADILEMIRKGSLQIGSEEKLEELKARFGEGALSEEDKQALQRLWGDFAKEVRIRIGTVLRSQRVSVLLGAGASRDAGGPVLANIPLDVEDGLVAEGLDGEELQPWLAAFYAACTRVAGNGVPASVAEIGTRRGDASRRPIAANYESVLFALHVWEEALAGAGVELGGVWAGAEGLDQAAMTQARERLVGALIERCRLPRSGDEGESDPLKIHSELVRRLLTRPTNLRRVGVFTVNYDTLVEQAADAEGAMLVDGFVGNVKRVFRPESYDYDFYFPAETTEGPIHRLDRVLQLYKLHGSINWRSVEQSWANPYGIESRQAPVEDAAASVIYPTPAKHGDALAMPYAELFRRFAASVACPQSVLITVGYGFPDEHLNAIIRQALAIPSFTLIIVDPDPKSRFVEVLRKREDQRVWIFSGALGYFARFVMTALPDLRESEVERKVVETYRAITREASVEP